jgi:hypothetical protein
MTLANVKRLKPGTMSVWWTVAAGVFLAVMISSHMNAAQQATDPAKAGNAQEANKSQTEDTKAQDTKADEKKADEKKADEKKADEKKVDEKKVDEKKVDEKKVDEKKVDEKKVDEKKADEKKADEKKAGEKKMDDKKTDDKKTDDKKATDKAGPNAATVKTIEDLAAKTPPSAADVKLAAQYLHHALKDTANDSTFTPAEWSKLRAAVEKLSGVKQGVDSGVASRLDVLRVILDTQRATREWKEGDVALVQDNLFALLLKDETPKVRAEDAALLLSFLELLKPKVEDDDFAARKVELYSGVIKDLVPKSVVIPGYAVRNETGKPLKIALGGRQGARYELILRDKQLYQLESVQRIGYNNGTTFVQVDIQPKHILEITSEKVGNKEVLRHKSIATESGKQEKKPKPGEGARYYTPPIGRRHSTFFVQYVLSGVLFQQETSQQDPSQEQLEGKPLAAPPPGTKETNGEDLEMDYLDLHMRAYLMPGTNTSVVNNTALLAYDCMLIAQKARNNSEKDERLNKYFTAFRKDLDKRVAKAEKDPQKSEGLERVITRIKRETRELDRFAEYAKRAKIEEPVQPTPPPTATGGSELLAKIANLEAQLGAMEGRLVNQEGITYDIFNGRAIGDQRYTDWEESQNGDYYFCKYHFRPQGQVNFNTYDCIWFERDPSFVYYYSRHVETYTTRHGLLCRSTRTQQYCCGTYWARYDISTGQMGVVPESSRACTEVGSIPDPNSFDSITDMPQVPFSFNSNQTIVPPNLIGLPGVAAPQFEYAPAPPMPMDFEAAPAPAPDFFDAPPPAPPAAAIAPEGVNVAAGRPWLDEIVRNVGAEFRVWTRREDARQATAKLVGFDGSIARMILESGQEVATKFESLSDNDQTLLLVWAVCRYRSWSNDDGTSSAEAMLTSFDGHTAKMRTRSGKVVSTTLDRLSAEDRRLLSQIHVKKLNSASLLASR